jgi:regulator of sirC expression with transglutaminase-like and TPR domain
MADELRKKLPEPASETEKLATLTKFLFAENGFHGSRSDFYNRANSYLNDVIDDREGLPITLSVLYIELARRVGISNVVGIPVPTRFMVKHSPKNGREQIIDVFDGGKALTRTEAIELVTDNVDAISGHEFQAATKRDIIVRMLRNLLGIAQRDGSRVDALRYLDVILALAPDSAMDRLNRARLLMQSGDNARAKEDLRWLLDHETPGLDLERIGELYRSL